MRLLLLTQRYISFCDGYPVYPGGKEATVEEPRVSRGKDFEVMNFVIAVRSSLMNSLSSSASVNQGPPVTSIDGVSS